MLYYDAVMGIILYGAGGHGKMVADAAESKGIEIRGFVDDATAEGVHGHDHFYGYAILGNVPEHSPVIVCVGDSYSRKRIQEQQKIITTIIHARAYVCKDAKIGKGTVVIANAIIGSSSVIGKGCIINTGATIDHDCALGGYVHIAPGAHLAGNVTVGNHTHIGIGSCVKEGIVIGSNCVIGAGSVVVKDIPDDAIIYGNPAKVRSFGGTRRNGT
jgi:UDP-N-acetylbacillosamine N-acetyltransferase